MMWWDVLVRFVAGVNRRIEAVVWATALRPLRNCQVKKEEAG